MRFRDYDEFLTQYTENISQGGLFIRTQQLKEVNQVVRLWLTLPGLEGDVEIIARVAHLRTPEQAAELGLAPGMGLEFLELDFAVKQRLSDYFLGGLTSTPVEKQTAAPASKESPAPKHLGTVLIVEDDGLLQRKIRKLLESRGMNVTVASSGAEGISKCLKEPPALILSDIEMPTLDGWGLLRMVKARPQLKAVPFVFLTARASETNRLKGYRQGVDDFLAKSTPPAEIVARLDRILARAQHPTRDSVSGWGLGGDLTQMSLATLLQMLELERKTGVLQVLGNEGAGTVHFKFGQPVACEVQPAGVTGTEGLFLLMDWRTGAFKFGISDVGEADDIGLSISALLMEHARRHDEGNR